MLGVSIIICCHNSADKLPATINHINKLVVPKDIPWEVIIVDNESTDGTSKVAADLLSLELKCIARIVSENKLGLRNARIKGAAESKYEYISFIDDDNWICPQWVQIVYNIMSSKSDIGACGGASEPAFEKTPPDWFESVQESFAVGRQCDKSGYVPDSRGYLWGGGLTVRRTAWNNLMERGFNFLLCGREGNKLSSGEDSELCFALRLNGWNLWYEESLKFVHFMPENRLTLNYLNRLYRAFGDASIILDKYKFIIHGSSLSKLSLLRNCFYDSIKLSYDSARFLAAQRHTLNKNNESIATIGYEYETGRAISCLQNMPLFLKYFNAIYNLRTSKGQ